MLLLCLLITCAIHAHAHDRDGIRNVKDYILDKAPVVERQLFHLRKNGLKVDVKVVPSYGNDSTAVNKDDHFPDFPARDIGECIIELSLGCVKRRFVRLLQSISRLDEITLLGQDVKLIRNRAARGFDQHSADARAVNDSADVGRAVDDFFGSFILRISLPRWNGKQEKNQIDVMLDETTAVEGRRKGGGGGGLGGCGGGKGGGGGCMMMMMGMLMMLKLKFLGLAALKGMMMGGMSMMMLLMQKLGKGGGGPWQSGGGPWQGGGQLKEIVLLTKSSQSSGSSCCGPSSSYGAPSPSSYGSSSGSGGYGGGGWGRSFHKRPMTLSYDETIKRKPVDKDSNGNLMIGEVMSKPGNMDYPDYQDYQGPLPIVNSNFTASHWNATNNIAFYEYNDVDDSLTNDSKLATNAKDWSFNGNSVDTKTRNERNDDDSMAGMKYQAGLMEGANSAYMDEWQATGEKINPSDVSSSTRNARVFELRSRHVPLLRGI